MERLDLQPESRSLLQHLAQGTLGLAGISLLGLVLVQTWQVYARYVRNDSPSWTEPVAVLLLATTMSLGAAACVHSRSHFSFQLLAQAAPPAIRRGLDLFQQLCVAVIGSCLAIWSWQLLCDGWAIDQAGIALPQSAAFAPMALSGLLMTVFALGHAWHDLRSSSGGQ